MMSKYPREVTVGGLKEYGRIRHIFTTDDEFEELDDKALLTVADGIVVKVKGTDYSIEITAVMREIKGYPHLGKARLHFRKCRE